MLGNNLFSLTQWSEGKVLFFCFCSLHLGACCSATLSHDKVKKKKSRAGVGVLTGGSRRGLGRGSLRLTQDGKRAVAWLCRTGRLARLQAVYVVPRTGSRAPRFCRFLTSSLSGSFMSYPGRHVELGRVSLCSLRVGSCSARGRELNLVNVDGLCSLCLLVPRAVNNAEGVVDFRW